MDVIIDISIEAAIELRLLRSLMTIHSCLHYVQFNFRFRRESDLFPGPGKRVNRVSIFLCLSLYYIYICLLLYTYIYLYTYYGMLP